MSREQLAPYRGSYVFCRGRIQRFAEMAGRGSLCIVLENVTIEPEGEQRIVVDHIWISRGLPADINLRYNVGEWISFDGRVWGYTHIGKNDESYGLAYPQDILRSYS
jgi:hypothetical protein